MFLFNIKLIIFDKFYISLLIDLTNLFNQLNHKWDA